MTIKVRTNFNLFLLSEKNVRINDFEKQNNLRTTLHVRIESIKKL